MNPRIATVASAVAVVLASGLATSPVLAAPPNDGVGTQQPAPERRQLKPRHLGTRYLPEAERQILQVLNSDPMWGDFRRARGLYIGGLVAAPVGVTSVLFCVPWGGLEGYWAGPITLMSVGFALTISGSIMIPVGLRRQRQLLRESERQVFGRPLVIRASPGGLTLRF